MMIEFEKLSEKTEALIRICQTLQQDNARLQHANQQLADENAVLRNQQRQLAQKIKLMISNLKILEGAQ